MVTVSSFSFSVMIRYAHALVISNATSHSNLRQRENRPTVAAYAAVYLFCGKLLYFAGGHRLTFFFNVAYK